LDREQDYGADVRPEDLEESGEATGATGEPITAQPTGNGENITINMEA